MLINRDDFLNLIKDSLEVFSVCALLGPRQCGKTTLSHAYRDQISPKIKTYFYDLEDPTHLDQLGNPKTALDPLSGLIIIDEVQRQSTLFPYLRVLSDYSDKKFLILGSASGALLRQSSESLAGRIEYIELTPLNLTEVKNFENLWLRGGFPKSYLAKSYEQSLKWRKSYIASFIEGDLPSLGITLNPVTMRKLWMCLAHYHGGLINYTNLGRLLNTTDITIKRYIEILAQTFMIRVLEPWHENISKRQVKAPKLYIRDTGILHALLGIREEDWYIHPAKGASFEGFVIEEIIRKFGQNAEFFFWRTQVGAELDLLMIKNGKRYGFEVKYADVPSVTKAMYIALKDLNLEHLYIVTAGNQRYQKAKEITVLGIRALPNFHID